MVRNRKLNWIVVSTLLWNHGSQVLCWSCLEGLQQSGVQTSESFELLGIMRASIVDPSQTTRTSRHYSISRGPIEPLNWSGTPRKNVQETSNGKMSRPVLEWPYCLFWEICFLGLETLEVAQSLILPSSSTTFFTRKQMFKLVITIKVSWHISIGFLTRIARNHSPIICGNMQI